MNERLRAVLLGLGLGLAPLLLLDLAQQLRAAAAGETGTSTQWWSLGVYLLVGIVVAAGVAMGRRDRMTPGVAGLVLLLAVLPGLPGGFDWLPRLPVITEVARGSTALVLVALGAYVYAAVRGGRG